MELRDYPRPQNDNGRGIHWFPTLGQTRRVVDQNIARLIELKIRWLVFWNGLDDVSRLVNDYLIQRLVAEGIAPVMHIYFKPIAPMDEATLKNLHRLVEYYRDPARRVDYFQIFYEPNVAEDWPEGRMPRQTTEAFLDAWLPAAQEVAKTGGLPGFSPLWSGGVYDSLKFLAESLDGIKRRGQDSLYNKMWIALHNYHLGHPTDFSGNPNSFQNFLWVDKAVTAKVGHSLPLLTTEGGTRAGDRPYGDGADEAQVATDTVQAYQFMENAPDYYFCFAPWILGNKIGGGTSEDWESTAWFRRDGQQQAVVEAVRQLPDAPRKLLPARPQPGAASSGKERYFPETKSWVRGAFYDFFTRYGPDVCGYPVHDAVTENDLPIQYFQRVVLEEFQPGKVRLRPVGEESIALRAQVAELQAAGKEAADLRQRVSELQAGAEKINALRARLAELQAVGQEAMALRIQLNELQDRLAQMDKELTQALEQIKRLESEKKQLVGQVEEMEQAQRAAAPAQAASEGPPAYQDAQKVQGRMKESERWMNWKPPSSRR